MRKLKLLNVVVGGLCLATGLVRADEKSDDNYTAGDNTHLMNSVTGNKWTFSGSVYGYVVPDQDDYVQPTITADYGPWHFEGRYNYEAQDTGSLWAGYSFGSAFGADDAFQWQVTPMLGGVFGDVEGIAPGYRGTLRWWKLMLYSEGEQLFSTEDSDQNFFYNWSELTLAPVKWFRFGVVAQRTRAYDSDRDIQRGLLIGATFKRVDVTAYALNLDEGDPTWVVSVASAF